jgi:hypothetical protein
MITVTVNGTEVQVAEGTTILSAAKQADAWVPTLCFDDRQAPLRRLPRLPGRRRGRPQAAACLHHPVPRRDGDRHDR